MTVLFGTVEYFKREILNYAASENQFIELGEDSLAIIKSKLEYEVLNDFVCDEKIRLECLNNLNEASNSLALNIKKTPLAPGI